ncbi:ion channel [Synechococcus sp. CCY 9618]|uniref:ion channel n=1 Tax=Synechococcus sp. CCY 9618 TaxID=2815602 RepID=UPI00352CAD1C
MGGTASGRARFDEAFFFSVQTLASIGYGVLHPTSLTVHLLVTVEAFLGLIFIALTTGLAFARFARSSARIRFSEVATEQTCNGVPTLMFRIASERRNTILEARLQAVLAIDERSAEGLWMRRLHRLPLVREQGATFLPTWTAMHVIDAASPLHGLGAADLAAANAEVLVAFRGIDETMERPVHARHACASPQLAFDCCFVDLVKHHGDGRRIDFSRFNLAVACPPPGSAPAT